MISPLWIPLAGTAVVPVTVIGFVLARAWAKSQERQAYVPTTSSPEVLARLERIEQAVDSIAVEVERISEAQRFTTRLLASRAEIPEASPALPGLPS